MTLNHPLGCSWFERVHALDAAFHVPVCGSSGILTPYVQLLSSSPALARACSPIAPDILSRLENDDGVFGTIADLRLAPICSSWVGVEGV